MSLMQPTARERARAAVPSVLLTVAIGWGLLAGLRTGDASVPGSGLTLFDTVVPPSPPPARVVPLRTRSSRPRGEAAPPNIRSRATELVAPVPQVPPLAPPPPLVTAPAAGPGAEASSGSAPRPGPGTGAGGIGTGYGSGGDGDGDGGDEGDYTAPRPRGGTLRALDRLAEDFPEAADIGLSLRYFVELDGRATRCTVTRSSGDRRFDARACETVERSFRYRPSLDPQGRPVRSIVTGNHRWSFE